MSQGLSGVAHLDLTFGDELNHNKYPVSSFPKRKGGIRLSLSLCSFLTQYLLTQPRSFCRDPEPVLHIRFSVPFPDVCRCLGEPGMAQMALKAHIQSRINYFCLQWNLNMTHTQVPHWNGEVLIHELNPSEGTKKTQSYVSVTSVSLCVW